MQIHAKHFRSFGKFKGLGHVVDIDLLWNYFMLIDYIFKNKEIVFVKFLRGNPVDQSC